MLYCRKHGATKGYFSSPIEYPSTRNMWVLSSPLCGDWVYVGEGGANGATGKYAQGYQWVSNMEP